MIGNLTREAKFNPKLYAIASNLARLALLVKGADAVIEAVRTHIFKDHDGKLRMNNDLLYAQTPQEPFFTALLNEVIANFADAIDRAAYHEYMDADPPHYNGAHFIRRHLNECLQQEPAIFLNNEPQITERNWHPKGEDYQNELPSSSP